jgi:AraC-like DNA-binding protein
MHTCPLGLRCAGVPIVLDDELIGLAKFVSGSEIPRERFRSLVSLLEVLVARPCQELHVVLLREEIQTLHHSVNQLRRTKRLSGPTGGRDEMPLAQEEPSDPSPIARTLIGQLLEYLNKHYAESELSLSQVADAVDKNPKYVTHLFAQQVGERMRTYITTLRVRRACELLLQTNRTIEQIASDSGFTRTVQFRQSFRRTIGVTASEYRQIFTAGV